MMQKRSANGRESRKKVKAMHTLGTKSYAQLREEEVKLFHDLVCGV